MGISTIYRRDIDGLRAVAVLGVVAYHFGASWLPGGFTGVDVFFVISGFVITAKLRREIACGEFSIFGFYEGRVRRILPALLTMLGVSLVLGWFLLMPGDYQDLGASAAYSAFGLGNLFFYGNTGYFDQAADLQPLLHTWSLGVEEQFYFVWPLLLLAGITFVRSHRRLIAILSVGLVAAFAYAVRKVGSDPTAAFYLPAPRAWELGLGAIIAFAPPLRNRALAETGNVIGIFLIATSFIAINSEMPFPGATALPACVGAALLVWPKATCYTAKILGMRLAVAIGLISYSLYLWHWPVLVFYRHYKGGAFPSGFEIVALAATTFSLAYLSWRFIEKPFRHKGSSSRTAVAVALATAALVAVPSLVVAQQSGFETRVPPETMGLSSLKAMWEWDCKTQYFPPLGGDYCVFGATVEEAKSFGIVWGDSHAEHAAALIEGVAQDNGIAFALLNNCPAALGASVRRVRADVPNYESLCADRRAAALRGLSDPRLRYMVLAGSWNPFSRFVSSETFPQKGRELVVAGLDELLGTVKRRDVSFILLDQVPTFDRDPVACHIAEVSGLIRSRCTDLGYRGYNASAIVQPKRFPGFDALARRYPFLTVVHPRDALCSDELQTCETEIDGELIFRDGNHLRRNLSPKARKDLAEHIGLADAIRSTVSLAGGSKL